MPKINFATMTKEEALEYCYRHKNKFIRDCYDANEDGVRMFDCLIAIVRDGTIEPSELPEYGMEY
jgi:hypothetical protein